MTKLRVRSGVDLVDIDRLRHMLDEDAEFIDVAFTAGEQAECGHDVARLAGRWAAKEAVMKALGRGIGRVSPLDIEVTTDVHGAPGLNLTGSAQARASEIHALDWSVSLTHERKMAIAMVIVTIGGEDA